MRPVHNFLRLPGQDDLASFVLKSLQDGQAQACVDCAMDGAHNAPRKSFSEACALAAMALARSGQKEGALRYWDKLISGAPQELHLLGAALAMAREFAPGLPVACEYERKWLKLLERLFIKVPPMPLLLGARQNGWHGYGSVGIHQGRLNGWLFMGVAEKVKIAISLPASANFTVRLRPLALAQNMVLYQIDELLPVNLGSFQIEILDPQGAQLPGSPVVVAPAHGRKLKSAGGKAVPPTILMPVYDDAKATLRCLASVIASKRKNRTRFDILVAWDAGPDASLLARLKAIAARGHFRLVVNSGNCGFLATVNQAITNYVQGDVILLNSDTLVHGDWVDRLGAHVARPDAATVTALGNEAELMSFPSVFDRGRIGGLRQLKILDRAAARLPAEKACLEIPVGVGFCMWITRAALRKTGVLDGLHVFRGYGEEADYCLRAAEAGLKNYGAFNVFVAHLGEASFGLSKKALAAQNNQAIRERFPAYSRRYNDFLHYSEPRRLIQEISAAILPGLAQAVELDIWPWSARALPFLQARELCGGAEGRVILFLRPGSQPAAELRFGVWLPVASLEFTGQRELAALKNMLNTLSIHKISLRVQSAGVVKMLSQSLRLEAALSGETANWPVLPSEAPQAAYLCATPLMPVELRNLRAFASRNANARIHVPALDAVWPQLPRPGNIFSLAAKLEPELLGCGAFLLPAAAGQEESWQAWLRRRGLGHLPCYRLGGA